MNETQRLDRIEARTIEFSTRINDFEERLEVYHKRTQQVEAGIKELRPLFSQALTVLDRMDIIVCGKINQDGSVISGLVRDHKDLKETVDDICKEKETTTQRRWGIFEAVIVAVLSAIIISFPITIYKVFSILNKINH